VFVPNFVPFITSTLTPGIGIPALSETTPVTTLSCAKLVAPSALLVVLRFH
jgi:hypothetical protein